MTKVYHLKHATPKMKYQHMKNVMEFRADLKDKQLNPPDRHIALADIKEMMGSDFHAWYDEIYKLRAANKDTEYEAAIFERLYQLTEHPANVAYDLEMVESTQLTDVSDPRSGSEREHDEAAADWAQQVTELRGR